MPTGNWDYTIVTGPEWKAVDVAMRAVNASLPDRFTVKLREMATPVIHDIQAAALQLPVHGAKHTGMRVKLGQGVGVRANPGGIRITTSMPQADEAALPRGYDNGLAGFRHPVFGNMDVWVHQTGGSWFRETISDHADTFEGGLADVLDEAINDIAQASDI